MNVEIVGVSKRVPCQVWTGVALPNASGRFARSVAHGTSTAGGVLDGAGSVDPAELAA